MATSKAHPGEHFYALYAAISFLKFFNNIFLNLQIIGEKGEKSTKKKAKSESEKCNKRKVQRKYEKHFQSI